MFHIEVIGFARREKRGTGAGIEKTACRRLTYLRISGCVDRSGEFDLDSLQRVQY